MTIKPMNEFFLDYHRNVTQMKNLPQCFILLFGRLTMHILLRILVPLHVVYLLRFVCSNKDLVPV